MDSTNIVIGRPCKHGHDGRRYRASRACVECQRARDSSLEGRVRLAASNKRRYAEIKPQRIAQQKQYRTTPRGRALALLQGAKARSKTPITLSIEWIETRLAAGKCELSGIQFDLSRNGVKGPYAPSIDRIDSSKGYSPDNCRIILWALNAAFSHWGAEVFRKIAIAWLECSECGASHDRDVNAARNILALALSAQRRDDESRDAANGR